MTFISYAQNYEDVVLWRALKGVANGFYIDVGAHDPTVHSVTRAFYDQGWRGINVEPVEAWFRRLAQGRPADINLCLAAGNTKGAVPFYDIAGTGLSTTEADVAERHRQAGHAVTEVRVQSTTLASICEEHVRSDVHFLKIDVEGATSRVIEGMDLTAVRPWIILIEATEPLSQQDDFQQWEGLITRSGYRFVYADGLNRYYLSNEKSDLAACFKYPPNIFDDFVLSHSLEQSHRTQLAETRMREAEIARDLLSTSFARQLEWTRGAEERAHRAETLEAELRRAFDEQVARAKAAEERAFARLQLAGPADAVAWEADPAGALAARLQERERQLEDVFRGRSWRWTAPLRALGVTARSRGPQAKAWRARSAIRRPPRPTIFIECTHTYHSDLNTGIQRVVRNVLRNAPQIARQCGYDVVPVILQGGQLCFADGERVLTDKQCAPPPPASPANASLTRRALRCFPGAGRRRRRIAADLLKPFRRRRAAASRPVSSTAAAGLDDYDRLDGSILLLLDSSWTLPIWPGTQRFRERGGTVTGVIYDLIPVTHSHTSVEELTVAFKAWLTEHFRCTDGFICISKSIAASLADYIRAEGGHERLLSQIGYFHLGSELDLIRPDDTVRHAVSSIFERDQTVFLMVGSIEPRKMQSYVLDAFDLIWARGGAATLLVVGRQSWKMVPFLTRVASHPQLGRQLFILRDASDAELGHCYRKASALVIASEIEGFGLPIVEAFQHGLPILCSDIPVFHEIAEGRAVFFSLADPCHLMQAVDQFCRTASAGRTAQRRPQSWLNWRESTEQLFAAVLRVHQHVET